ncbi:DNA cytosine methyltransferase [Mesorhizobium sp. BR-1-1-8]|uniref:DNA cytosine methyltransferase n=1 Tax=Mesorhizobium sp. BR-1-1-8 TaxID=2876659 RepID=UPI001CCB56DD|nr:DNA cytosine methyltransferase [Mesorhizobium sp. BR-1-1-8]MBZ9984954.1 DNA cytosine methyltransferase [Mesorhizobium sp. BR-1-1-8]
MVNHLFPEDQPVRVLDLFSAAAGGWSLGMHRAGYRTIAACEVIDWRRVLYSQNNPGVPVYDDVTTLTAERLVRDGVGLPDIIVGSPPCQDISSANTKGKGVDGERSGLYFEAIRLVDECRPRWFALENSANLRTRGADRVIDALEAIGYTCWPFVVSAGDIGANHERKRSWLIGFNLSHADDQGKFRRAKYAEVGIVPTLECIAGDATQDGCGQGRARGRAFAIEGLSVEACGDAANSHKAERREDEFGGSDGSRNEGGRIEGPIQSGGSNSPRSTSTRNPPHTNQEGQTAGLLESSPRPSPQSSAGCGDRRIDDGQSVGQVDRSACLGPTPPEPWADWNGGLAHHLRVDDGLSGWVAQSRIAVGGPRGTVAASLIVEAFGDAVLPQIPEAIGRAISRVEAALAAVLPAASAANNNTPQATKAAA